MMDQDEAANTQVPCRALAVIEPRHDGRGDERPASEFLAQLIACQRRLPAYRAARKADPGPASSAYSRRLDPEPLRLDCCV